ncbi:OLC1v1003072C3 [Oldenlandia corymbosa var. corymbosa]|nr:OLC1v1003072C3 [Oldenlandia corymbosa var. corymbosa]
MVLKCESGGPWPVRVVKTGNDVFLRHGWQEFVQDNSLQENNFLFFTYDGNAELAVQIFEDTGLERDYSAAASETHQEDDASPRVQNLGREARDPKEEINGDREERIRSFLSSCGNDLFEKQMRRHNVANPFTLRIPLEFAEEHLGRNKTVVRLISAKSQKSCKVNYTYNVRNKQCTFVGGWGKFARRNNLKIGNFCIFELVGERTFRVFVF